MKKKFNITLTKLFPVIRSLTNKSPNASAYESLLFKLLKLTHKTCFVINHKSNANVAAPCILNSPCKAALDPSWYVA